MSDKGITAGDILRMNFGTIRAISILTFFVSISLSSAAPRPNIVYIMADDLGWSDVGYNGAKFYETPNIDRMRAAGMEFTSAYPGAANCMPSRASIMSGSYTSRTQMWTPGSKAKGETAYMKFLVPRRGDQKGDDEFPSKAVLDPSVTSVAEVLNTAGYRTARFGKWHLGLDTQGFDVSDAGGNGKGVDGKYYGDIDVAERLTDSAIDFMGKNKTKPFFIYLCHWDVHTPIRARKEVVAKYKKKLSEGKWDREWNTTYAAMIEAVDISVGRIQAALKANGISKDTLVVFTSDNGGHSGATWCEPLKGAKGAFFEGGIRVPACMTWPAVIKARTRCDVPITGVDVMPSFAELAGAKLPKNQPVDGRSWVPLLSGRDALQDRAIFWHYPLYLAGGTYNQVLPIQGTDRNYWRATPCSVIRQGDWKLLQFFEDDSIRLYNLKKDIGETQDLAESESKRAAAMLETLKAWQRNTEAAIPTRLNPDFDPKFKPKMGKRKRKKA
jgi:arylsulfatase A-like enzyme